MRRIRVTSDGSSWGTAVIDAETGETVKEVQAVRFEHNAGESPRLELVFVGVGDQWSAQYEATFLSMSETEDLLNRVRGALKRGDAGTAMMIVDNWFADNGIQPRDK